MVRVILTIIILSRVLISCEVIFCSYISTTKKMVPINHNIDHLLCVKIINPLFLHLKGCADQSLYRAGICSLSENLKKVLKTYCSCFNECFKV